MTSRNLARRLERLEESLLPVLEEPIVLKIICVSRDGSSRARRLPPSSPGGAGRFPGV